MPKIPQVWLVTGGGWLGRGIQIVAQLVAVRILTEGLGTAGYGAFAVLASLQGWFLLADFGIGISVQNYISEGRARTVSLDNIILTGAVLSLALTTAVAAVLFLVGPWIATFLLENFKTIDNVERITAFYAIALSGVGTALGSVVYKIWFAEHRGYLSQLVPAIATVIGTSAIWISRYVFVDIQIAPMVLLYYLPAAILPLMALAMLLIRRRAAERFVPELARSILTRGLRFWVFGLLQAGVLQVDYIVMARVISSDDIVIYSISSRLFSLVLFLYSALLMALWPVFVEEIANSNWDRVFFMLKKYLIIGFGISISGGLFIAIFNADLISVLAPSLKIHISSLIIGLLTLNLLVRTWTDMFAMTLQCMNDLAILWIAVPVQSLLSVSLQTLGAKQFGLPGMIAGLIFCFLLTVSWILPLRFLVVARRIRYDRAKA